MSLAIDPHEPNGVKQHLKPNMHQLAWLVLWASFGLFFVFCASSTFSIYHFVFRSTVPLGGVIAVAKGAVGIVHNDLSESFELDQSVIARGDQVITDSQSQAVLNFRNDETQNLVAVVTVKGNSVLVVRGGLQPRFGWSIRPYTITLEAIQGDFDIFIPETLNRPNGVNVQIKLPQNTLVDIRNAGRHHLVINEQTIQLNTDSGQAAMLDLEDDVSQSVGRGQMIVFDRESRNLLQLVGYENLVSEYDLAALPVQGDMPTTLMNSWNCDDRSPESTRSTFISMILDNRNVIELLRGGNARSHGETRCVQPFGPSAQTGLLLENYDYLDIRATFYIESHSLDLCGDKGSECPLMLLMDYIDTEGRSNQWFHGFYTTLEARRDYPASCVSCQEPHERINNQEWYTYESGNLFRLLPDRTPASILNLRFYASGHEYRLFVDEVSLRALNHETFDLIQTIEGN